MNLVATHIPNAYCLSLSVNRECRNYESLEQVKSRERKSDPHDRGRDYGTPSASSEGCTYRRSLSMSTFVLMLKPQASDLGHNRRSNYHDGVLQPVLGVDVVVDI